MRNVAQTGSNFNSLELALAYLERHPGRFIFPIASQKKFPPLLKNNLELASNDPEQIRKWAKKFPDCNWGVSLKKSNLFVVDVDTKPGKNGQRTYDDLDIDYGWPETETVTTPSGGFHKYHDGEHIFALGVNGLGDGIDSPNYVIMAGSVMADGTSYRLTEDLPTAPKPSWFAEVIRAAKKERIENADVEVINVDQPGQIAWAIDYLLKDAEPSIEGQNGDLTTFRVACSLKDNGISEGKALELLDIYYNVPGSCDPEWDYDDLEAKVKNAYTYASLSKTGGKSAEAEFVDLDIMADAASIVPAASSGKIEAERKARKAAKSPNANGLKITRGSDIKPTNLDWIWPNYLARAKHTAIAGVQGDGKSMMVYGIAACVTTGSEWPGSNKKAPQGHVIIFQAEDTGHDMIAPRLLAAGADMDYIHIVNATMDKGKERKFNLQDDLAKLQREVERINAEGDSKVVLVTFDPVSSYMGGDVDSHNNTDLRAVLDPLSQMAEVANVAVISVTHFNKSGSGVSALNRVMGSAAFTAAPRAAFAVIRDAENPEVRMMLSLKSNISAPGDTGGMTFTVQTRQAAIDYRDQKPIYAPYVVWGAPTDITADEALRAQQDAERIKRPSPALDEAMDFLRELLANGRMLPVADINAEAEACGISKETLRRARAALGVRSAKVSQRDGRGPWRQGLPDEAGEEFGAA